MARPSTLTFEQVAAHADSLKANGIKPTARAIRGRVGTGSMATLLKTCNSGKANRPARHYPSMRC